MKIIHIISALAFGVLTSISAQGQTAYYVRPGATGSGNGSDWTNAMPKLPTALVRGAVYYIAAGNYGKYTFNSPVSGSTYCTVRKATANDHGTSTGWQSSYADQAVFTLVSVNQNYFIFDGVTGGGPGSWITGFGIKIDTSSQTSNTAYPAVFLGELRQSATSYVTVSHVEIVGNGGDGVANNGGQTNDGIASWGGSNVTISYSYIHDMGRCICIFLTSTNVVFEYNYTGKYEYDYGEHSEIASMNGNTQTFRNNIFSHIEGTGGLMFNGSGFDIYGNVFFHSANDKSWGYAANGIIGSKDSSEPIRNARIYNNTFYRPFSDNAGGGPQIFGFYMGTDSVAYNNLFYGTMPSSPGFNYVTHDYNHFVDITGASLPSETNRSTASGNPFVNAEGLNFTLTTNTPAGKNLGAPYNIDPLGRTRSSWTRGAYEFATGGATPTPMATATATPTPIPTATPTPIPTPTPAPSPTPTPSTPTPTPSPTSSPTPTVSPSPSPTQSPQPPKGLQVLPTT